jgi:hypothetical protein
MEFEVRTSEKWWEIYRKLKAVNSGFSDRRLYHAVAAVQAWAYVEGADTVEVQHLEVLQHILCDHSKREKRRQCQKIVLEEACPTSASIVNKTNEAKDAYKSKKKNTEIDTILEKIKDDLYTIEKDCKTDLEQTRFEAAVDYVRELQKLNDKREAGMMEPTDDEV